MNFKQNLLLTVLLMANTCVVHAMTDEQIAQQQLMQALNDQTTDTAWAGVPPALAKLVRGSLSDTSLGHVSAQEVFDAARELSKNPDAGVILGLDTQKKLNEFADKLYTMVLMKEGASGPLPVFLRGLPKLIPGTPAPLAIKAAHNLAVCLYEQGDIDAAETYFSILMHKGFEPSKSNFDKIQAEKPARYQESIRSSVEETYAVSAILARQEAMMARFGQKLFNPDELQKLMRSVIGSAINTLQGDPGNGQPLTDASRAELKEALLRAVAHPSVGDMLRVKCAEECKAGKDFMGRLFDPLKNQFEQSAGIATSGDLRGAGSALAAFTAQERRMEEISATQLFKPETLEGIWDVTQHIQAQVGANDTLIFSGRSPLPFARMLKAMRFDAARVLEIPFSNAGVDMRLLTVEQQANYHAAQNAYVEMLQEHFGLRTLMPDQRVVIVDRCESGKSAINMRKLLMRALSLSEDTDQIVILPLTYKRADTDPVIPHSLNPLEMPKEVVLSTSSNETQEGIAANFGRPFSWGQWKEWRTFMMTPFIPGGVAMERQKQIEGFAAEKRGS